MNTIFLLKVVERMRDRKLASMVETASAGRVTARTVRNWINKRTTPDPTVVEEIQALSRASLLDTLADKGWPVDEREDFAKGLLACPGFISSLAYSFQSGDAKYPAFIQLASLVDLLEKELLVHRENQDLDGWVQTLLEADWIRDEHFVNPDDGTSAETTRRQLREAKSWEDMIRPCGVLVFNIQLQLLATLDLEFRSNYLSGWEATPIFASLLPRLSARATPSSGTTMALTRDLFHYPTRRLLDVVACMRTMRESPCRNWPRAMPAVQEMETWLHLAGRADLASNLAKWRSGRTLPGERFEELWDACFNFLSLADRPCAPMPMFYAATVFSVLFILGSRAERNMTFMSPDPALYQHWWDIQHKELSTGTKPLYFGTEKWIPDLL